MEMLIDVLANGDPSAIASALALMSGMVITLLVISFIRYLMIAIGYSKMFRKANIAGWKAFIPLYNDYTKYNMVWKGMFFFLFLALNLVISISGRSSELIPSLLSFASGIGMLVIAVKQHILMAKAFDKGVGTALLLIIFPGITSLVLGFGKAQYIGQ